MLMPVSRKPPPQQSRELPPDVRVAVVTSRFNSELVDELLRGCQQQLDALKLDESRIALHAVPGAFELPLAAKLLAQTQRFAAVICLGCVIRGQTPHFDYVAGQCASGIQQAALETGVPVIFGVLTCDNEQQARERLGGAHGHAGVRAADAAADMIALTRSLRS
jgi:6,7-dimethyl-8-ribityllumazine synthase